MQLRVERVSYLCLVRQSRPRSSKAFEVGADRRARRLASYLKQPLTHRFLCGVFSYSGSSSLRQGLRTTSWGIAPLFLHPPLTDP